MDSDEIVDRLLSRISGAKLSGDSTFPRAEVASTGIDEFTQGLTTDPFASLDSTGLRVPSFVPFFEGATLPLRYLFQLASLTISTGERVCIRGIRQLLEIGRVQAQGSANYPIVLPVTTRNWKFVDGNVSWHLMRVPFRTKSQLKPTNAENFIYRNALPSGAGALLYEAAGFPAAHVDAFGRPDFYVNLNFYAPPNGGFPYGTPLLPTIHDLRFPWDEVHSSNILKLLVDGPAHVVLFASVLQTNSGRIISGISPANLSGMPEEQFLINFSTPSTPVGYWRVGGMIDAEWVR